MKKIDITYNGFLTEIELLDEQKVLNLVRQELLSLQDIEEDDKTYKICIEAVKLDGFALEFVPEEYRTEEMCLIAVKDDGIALEFVPKECRTKKMCLEAIKENARAIMFLDNRYKQNESNLSEEDLSELYILAIKKDKKLFRFADLQRFPKVCLEVVNLDGLMLEFIKDQTIEMCLDAVTQNKKALKFVDQDIFKK